MGLFWTVHCLHNQLFGLRLTIVLVTKLFNSCSTQSNPWSNLKLLRSKGGVLVLGHAARTLCIDPTKRFHRPIFCPITHDVFRWDTTASFHRLYRYRVTIYVNLQSVTTFCTISRSNSEENFKLRNCKVNVRKASGRNWLRSVLQKQLSERLPKVIEKSAKLYT